MPPYPFAAVLFDMDGTILDNVPLHQQVWREFTRRHGLDLSDAELDFAKGRKAVEAVAHFFGGRLSPEDVTRVTAERQAFYRERLATSDLVRPVAGVEEFLAGLKAMGVPRVLATDAPMANVEAVFRRFPFASYFDAIVTSDTIRHGKPSPEIFLAAAARAGIPPGRCLVAEDSLAGVMAAKAAGCACLGVSTTQAEADLRREGADFVAADFRGLPQILALPAD
jgi:beta-phosphoglucomutase